jgi:hypothetical protein
MARKQLRMERGTQQTRYISRQLQRENNITAAAEVAAAAEVGGDSSAPRPWLEQCPHYTMVEKTVVTTKHAGQQTNESRRAHSL